jgi:hypothetical protein
MRIAMVSEDASCGQYWELVELYAQMQEKARKFGSRAAWTFSDAAELASPL